MSSKGLRLMTFDDTDWESGLTQSWFAGGMLYRLFRSLDHCRSASNLKENFTWLKDFMPEEKVAAWQFWGHGYPGGFKIGKDFFTVECMEPGHPIFPALDEFRSRLTPDSLIWLRTCASFQGVEGRELAVQMANFFGCRVAAHTRNIGAFHSGLYSVSPGRLPAWKDSDGENPHTGELLGSNPLAKHTVTFLHGNFPKTW